MPSQRAAAWLTCLPGSLQRGQKWPALGVRSECSLMRPLGNAALLGTQSSSLSGARCMIRLLPHWVSSEIPLLLMSISQLLACIAAFFQGGILSQ